MKNTNDEYNFDFQFLSASLLPLGLLIGFLSAFIL